MASPIAPWHMWGNKKLISVHIAAGQNQTVVSEQLTRTQYKRPDTWSFLLGARLIAGATDNPVDVDVFVDFVLIPGIGRSSIEIDDRAPLPLPPPLGPGGFSPAFCRFVFRWAGGAVIPIGQLKWATSVPSPLFDDADASSSFLVDHFPAEDFQSSSRVGVLLSAPAVADVTVEVHAYFAPRSHVRPDWVSDGDQFLGGEIGGT